MVDHRGPPAWMSIRAAPFTGRMYLWLCAIFAGEAEFFKNGADGRSVIDVWQNARVATRWNISTPSGDLPLPLQYVAIFPLMPCNNTCLMLYETCVMNTF